MVLLSWLDALFKSYGQNVAVSGRPADVRIVCHQTRTGPDSQKDVQFQHYCLPFSLAWLAGFYEMIIMSNFTWLRNFSARLFQSWPQGFFKKNSNGCLTIPSISVLVQPFLLKDLKRILADRVVSCPFQKMAAHTVFGQSKVLWHKISTLSTFVLPNFQCIVICWCFSATCCCGGNGPILSKSHEKPHPNSNWN